MLTSEQFEEGVAYAEKNFTEDVDSHLYLDKMLIKQQFDLSNKKVLDFGCGMGGMALWYATAYDNCQVYGLDIDSHHIQITEHLINKHNIPNIVCDKRNILDDPLRDDERFDYIFFNDVVEHIQLPILTEIFKQVSQHLTEDGKIFVTYPPWAGPYASHVTRDVGIYWCQFLPEKMLMNRIKKNNRTIVGDLESDLVSVYKGLNHLTHKKMKKVIAATNLKLTSRKTHSVLNKLPLMKNLNVNFFPFNYLVTKEFLLLEQPK